MHKVNDNWAQGDAYEQFMGRWSRRMASAFVDWLDPKPNQQWLDIGCGTGALTTAIVRSADPRQVIGCEPSATFVDYARRQSQDRRTSFVVAGVDALPEIDGGFDLIVSGLVFNFFPSPDQALTAMIERLRPGGRVAAYVWDYAERMDFLRAFWDEAIALDPGAEKLDEGKRFPLCAIGALRDLFSDCGLSDIRAAALEIPTEFASFADFWTPFLEGTGPAPSYVASLTARQRERLEEKLKQRLTPNDSRPVDMIARAWAVCGSR